jgi:hypothetical protein
MVNSAGSCDEFADTKEIAIVGCILSKRKYIDWANADKIPADIDIRPERLDQEGPFEYLV